jgi:hypothetical protein
MPDISSLSVDASLWGDVDTWALIFVAIGVIGEGIAEYHPTFLRLSTSALKRLSRISWITLVAALVVEVIAQGRKEGDGDRIVAALAHKISVAQMNLEDRSLPSTDTEELMRGPFGMASNLGGHVGQELHILVVQHDDEAERFAESIKDVLHGLYTWDVKIYPLEEGPSINNLYSPTSTKAKIGKLHPGIFGPFGGDDKNGKLNAAKGGLYRAFVGDGFCISPNGFSDLVDPSPAIITLVIGHKDRHAADCR